MRWHHIKSAPKNGKSFLVYCPERKNTYQVIRDKETGELVHFGPEHSKLIETPSHWMHLPGPPAMHPCHTTTDEPGPCSWGSPSDPACTGCVKRG